MKLLILFRKFIQNSRNKKSQRLIHYDFLKAMKRTLHKFDYEKSICIAIISIWFCFKNILFVYFHVLCNEITLVFYFYYFILFNSLHLKTVFSLCKIMLTKFNELSMTSYWLGNICIDCIYIYI